jgi:iron uptake system component EfeO
VADYKTWVVAEVDGLVADTARFTDAVRAGDLAEARRQFAPSRVRWERIEPIAGLVAEIDGKVDARVDDFEGVDDPQFTGWHRLEYHLWKLGSTKGTKGFADQLDKDIATLDKQIKTLEFPPAAVALGPAELIEEVSEGKITGEEDRYSHTDLSDFDANVDGSRKLFELLTPALQAKDAALVSGITAVDKSLAPYAKADAPSTTTPP